MALVSRYVEAPYQGVSQAPPQVRLETQAQDLLNRLVVIPDGSKKRPPFNLLGSLLSDLHQDAAVELIDTVDSERLLLVVNREGSDIIPYLFDLSDLSVVPVTVSAEAEAYINDGVTNPNRELGITTIAGTTFVTNRTKVVENAADANTDRPFEAIIWCRQSAYGREYAISVDPAPAGSPIVGTYKTPTGATAASTDLIDTDFVIETLLSGSVAATDGASASGTLGSSLASAGFTVIQDGAVLYISHPSTDFTVDVRDGQGGTALVAVKGKVRTVSDLPQKAYDGFTVRVAQQGATDTDDYFMTYEATAGASTGIWRESLAPGAVLGLDNETMPMGLFKDDMGDWQLDVLDWKQRTVGDDELVPDPPFIGARIADVSFWRSRLAIIAGESCSLAEATDPFNLYPTTLLTVPASDPVYLQSPFKKTSLFRYAEAYEDRLLIFSDLAEFQVTSDGPVTPNSVDIDVVARYEVSPTIRPQPNNRRVYFAAPLGDNYSTVYELNVDAITDNTEAEDMTLTVPRYIPRGIDRASSSIIMFTSLYAESGSRNIFAHLYRYSDRQRVQNAWMKWQLPEGFALCGLVVTNTQVYVLAKDSADEGFLLRADLTPQLLDPDATATILTHLDFRVQDDHPEVTLLYDSGLDRTTITVPWTPTDDVVVTVRAPGGEGGIEIGGELPEALEGEVVEIVDRDPGQVVLSGKWDDCPLWIGIGYPSYGDLSIIYYTDQNGKPVRSGRLQLRRIKWDVAATGFMQVIVTPQGRAARTYQFSGYITDDPQSQLDVAPNLTTTFTTPIQANNERVSIRCENNSHFGDQLLGFTWFGDINPKARNV